VRFGNGIAARSALGVAIVVGLALLDGTMSAAPGADDTVRALSAARGQGFFFEIGERRALFVGAFHGVLYVESGAQALDGVSMVCPASFVLDRFQPTFTAEGYCTFARGESDKIYARWTCAGGQPRGCAGRLTLQGGTGRFAGISGESELVVRTALAEFKELAPPLATPGGSGVVQETAAALFILPALRHRLP
jgi:hypothetical protein